MIVLDENILGEIVVDGLKAWYKGKVVSINKLRADTVVKDDAVPAILRTVKQPTFLTTNIIISIIIASVRNKSSRSTGLHFERNCAYSLTHHAGLTHCGFPSSQRSLLPVGWRLHDGPKNTVQLIFSFIPNLHPPQTPPSPTSAEFPDSP